MNFAQQRNNKVDILEKEIIKSKLQVDDLRTETERVILEYETLQNKNTHSEVRYDALIEESKDESYKVIHMKQEEDHLEVDDTMKKIDNEKKLDMKEELHEEE